MAPDTSDDFQSNRMHIEIGSINSHGHVVIAGRDAQVSGHTKDDDNAVQTIHVAGIQTTPQAFASLQQSLSKVDKAIAESDLSEEEAEAAKANAQSLKQQMTSERKPNQVILVQAAAALYKYGPKLAGTIVALFTNPLVGEIVEVAGEKALAFYRQLRSENPDAFATST
jgi:hypothetical protein